MAKRILVVDDDPDLRDATEIILSAEGYEVSLAASSAEATEKLAAEKIDLVLLDVMLETETEGFHLAYRIRQDTRYKDVPIVMLTCIEEKSGEILEPDKAEDFLPVQAFLRKPLDPKNLKEILAGLLA